MGISRSATVVAAYLVYTRKMTGADAIAYVQKKRIIVCPNLGFRQQLDVYADKHVGRDESREAQFSPLRQIKAWTTAVKSRKDSSGSLAPVT